MEGGRGRGDGEVLRRGQRGGRGGPGGRSPASPGGRSGAGRGGGHSPPRDGPGRAAGGGPGSLRRGQIGQRLPGEGVASGRPALGGLRAGRCRRDERRADETTSPGARGAPGGRRRQLLSKGRGSPVPLAAPPKVAAGRGGGGGAGLIPGRAAAPPLRQPAGGLEAAAPPGLGCRGRAAPRLRPGQSRRQPLPAASVLDCSFLAARATSSSILERLLSRVPLHLPQPTPLSYLQPFFLPPLLPYFCLSPLSLTIFWF